MIALNILFLVVGFAALVKGADYFVEGASGIADKFGIPQIIIGLTIVAFGTSAPELAVSVSAALKGSTEISVGNVIGSNILNILIILGITACIAPIAVQKNTVRFEIPFVIVVSVLLVVIGAVFGQINLIGGTVLLTVFVLFFVYLIISAKSGGVQEEAPAQKQPMWKLLLFTVCGLAAVIIGSQLAVNGASEIARALGVSERFIGLTIVALGTSLPELMTSVTAARKGKNDIAIGNIVGSNIFNVLLILGVTALIKPIPFASEFIIDGIVAIAAAVLLLVGVLNKNKKLGRATGVIMLLSYAAYFVFLLI